LLRFFLLKIKAAQIFEKSKLNSLAQIPLIYNEKKITLSSNNIYPRTELLSFYFKIALSLLNMRFKRKY
jgi:hypothetical protein